MSGRKRHRVKKELEIHPYQPDWAILSDYILATGAPEPAKNLGPDLCRSFILLVDRLVYASKPVPPCASSDPDFEYSEYISLFM